MTSMIETLRRGDRLLSPTAEVPGIQTTVDKLCAFLLAITPLLQHYKGIYVEAAVCVLVLCIPWIGLKLLCALPRLRSRDVAVVLPILLYQIYRVIDHGTTFLELAHGAVLAVYFLAAAVGCIQLRWFIRSTFWVAMAAAFGIIVQYICWYVFGFHLQMVATDLLLEESHAWVALAQTGTISINGVYMGFYRPSAFFLEPSHMFLYLMPHLFLLLLAPNITRMRRICAAILSLGLVFSTSGMGIAVVAGVWLLQLGFTSGPENQLKIRNLFRWKNIRNCILFLIVFLALCLCLPSLQKSILRIFMSKEAVEQVQQTIANETTVPENIPSSETVGPNSNAISGRTTRGLSLVRKMRGVELIIGVADNMNQFDFNKAGFVATMYKYGAIGLLLTYFLYLYGAVCLKAPHRWFAIIILGVSFFSAHTHGTFYMLYYYFVLLDGHYQKHHRTDTPLCVTPE